MPKADIGGAEGAEQKPSFEDGALAALVLDLGRGHAR